MFDNHHQFVQEGPLVVPDSATAEAAFVLAEPARSRKMSHDPKNRSSQLAATKST